ncbi:MAG: hypothetical protein V3V92_05645, partial [Candidatus Hydrothermarchaeales archaeon]
MKRLQKEIITRPDFALPIVYILFLVLAFISLRTELISRYILAPQGAFQTPGLRAYGTTFMGIIILALSANFGARFNRRINPLWLMPAITLLALTAMVLGTPLPIVLVIIIA